MAGWTTLENRIPPTIDDPATLEEVKVALERLGYARETAAPIGG
ncbi:MAG: hypothetical protein ACREOC_16230 [Gemmatimonadales bacterium]